MPGQTNSWMGRIQISPTPCIGDTVRQVSSTSQDGSSGPFDSTGGDITNESTMQSASLWWLIVGGLVIGLIYSNNKKRKTQ
jgi:hypothetical protein